jgi:drug/metabolite transporter (DMT)-like permease
MKARAMRMLGPIVIIGLLSMISCTVAANLFMKLGATTPAAERWLFGIVDWKLLARLLAFTRAALIYAALLEIIALNVAQALASAQFIAVIIASNLVLGEPISATRWAGIALITAGIFIRRCNGKLAPYWL